MYIYIYMYVCMYVCMYTRIYIYIYVYDMLGNVGATYLNKHAVGVRALGFTGFDPQLREALGRGSSRCQDSISSKMRFGLRGLGISV